MKYKLLCLFVLFSFSISDLYADIELSSKQMRTSDGLPSNSVRCMFQDSKGFLWLGTLDGLTRYDGNTFLTYQKGLHFLPSQAASFILMICLVFFAFTTILGWNYYGERCLEYLSGKNKTAVMIYRKLVL